jgi:NAD-dependent SIR2 family protein deacetylase
MPPQNIIFLGAGGSAAEGAPIQGTAFREYAKHVLPDEKFARIDRNPYVHHNAVPRFFRDFFGIDLYHDNLDSVDFPTFEEALGILQLARSRNESYGPYSYKLAERPANSPNIDQMAVILAQTLALTIAHFVSAARGVHASLVDNLSLIGKLSDVLFVSTNYDTYIDSALDRISPSNEFSLGWTLNEAATTTTNGRPRLLKIHGSLDWLFCRSCLAVHRDPEYSHEAQVGKQCQECKDFLQPLIVPPTFIKDFGNPVLSSVWWSFDRALRSADRVVFCGYSFPDADVHIKYAFKRREIIGDFGNLKPLTVAVVNNHPEKYHHTKEEEKRRFSRFFRCDVHYTDLSFEDFAKDPGQILAR